MPGSDFRSAAHQLAAIVEWSDDAIVSKDLHGTITSWNRSAERMFGYTASEAIGRSIRIIVPDDRLDEEDGVLARIRHGEAITHFETWRRRKDGRPLPMSLTISPIRNEDGVVIGASTIARDISDEQRTVVALAHAAQAQQELQDRLKALVAASHTLLVSPRVDDVASATLRVATELLPADACAIWRQAGESPNWHAAMRVGLSDRFEASTTRAWQPARTRAVDDVTDARFPPQDVAALQAEGIASLLAVPLSIKGETSGILTFYYRTRHPFTPVDVETAEALGSLVSAALTTAELYDAQRTSRRRSEFLAQASALMAAASSDREVIAHLVERIVPALADWCAGVLVDENGQADRVSVARTDLVTESEPFPTGVTTPSVTSGGNAATTQVTVGLSQVLKDGLPVLVSSVGNLSLDGLVGAESYICVPFVARGRTLGALAVARGARGEPFTHADLLLLQDAASAAAMAIDNTQVYEALRRADRLKDEFLATLSHELRTPLNAILGYARMLKSGQVPDDRRDRAFEVLERNASALTQIVDDVLDVSRIISGKIRLEVAPLDLVKVVVLSIETVQAAADAKGVRLATDMPAGEVPIVGDVDRLQQICWNLLINAVKFTPRGGRILVALHVDRHDVTLTVADTGVGIAPEFLDHMFQRFRQADSRFAREHGGLGLGLAIAKHFTELHGGQISAESAGIGQGATFRVTLPLSRADAQRVVDAPVGSNPARPLVTGSR